MSYPYFCVKDPDATLVHTTVATDTKTAIENWMDIEGSMNRLANAFRSVKGERRHCFKSWEQFEAEGYSVVECHLIESKEVYAKMDKGGV